MLKTQKTLFSRALTCLIIYAITAVIFAYSLAQAADVKVDIKPQAVKILKKYNLAAAVDMQVQKSEEKKALGTSTSTEGNLIYSRNKIYFTTEKPNKTEIIYNKNVWVIEYPDLELDDKAGRKVTVFEADKVAFLKAMAELFSAPDKFISKDAVMTETDTEITIEIKKIKQVTLKELKVVLSKTDKNIISISLVDDLDTQTQFKFLKTSFLKKSPASKFVYKKLKTDEVLKP